MHTFRCRFCIECGPLSEARAPDCGCSLSLLHNSHPGRMVLCDLFKMEQEYEDIKKEEEEKRKPIRGQNLSRWFFLFIIQLIVFSLNSTDF